MVAARLDRSDQAPPSSPGVAASHGGGTGRLRGDAGEEWREIPSFPEYEASSLGRIRRSKPGRWFVVGRIIPPRLNHGYPIVDIRKNKKAYTRPVHRLVLEAFEGPSDLHCRHLNGIRTDNRIENLRWGTPSENAEDRREHGTLLVGALNPRTKIPDEEIPKIRESDESPAVLAERYGVHVMHIYAIKRGTKRCSIN